MKIRAIALNTFAGLVRDKIIVVLCAIFVCIMLLMLAPLGMMRTLASQPGMESTVLSLVGAIMSLVSGFGSLLAAWAAGNAVGSEIRSGTILAVLARPVRRWEYLLGKFLGVQMLMAVFVAFLCCFSYLLVWIGGQQVNGSPWLLIAYPLVRYAIYSALAMLLAARLHPTLSFAIVLVLAAVTPMVLRVREAFPVVTAPLYALLPSTTLLSEQRFLELTKANLKPVSWTDHATALAYGLDYALVCFLLAALLFRKRSVTRD
jgi:ABC-type transport system involved in multi-copper enzyme maturation permease subunit